MEETSSGDCDSSISKMIPYSYSLDMTYELFLLSTVFNLNNRFTSFGDNLERPVFHVWLNFGVVEFPTDQTLSIENGVVRVHGDLVLGGITDQTFRVVESDVRWGRSVSLVIGWLEMSALGNGFEKVAKGWMMMILMVMVLLLGWLTNDFDSVVLPNSDTWVCSTLYIRISEMSKDFAETAPRKEI